MEVQDANIFSMDPISPPTAKEVFAQMSQPLAVFRLSLIVAVMTVSGSIFFRAPWDHDGSLVHTFIQSSIVAFGLCVAFGQLKRHETSERQAWRQAWFIKLENAGMAAAIETLKQDHLDPETAQVIQDWIIQMTKR